MIDESNVAVVALRQYAKTLAKIHQGLFERIIGCDQSSTPVVIEALEFLGARCTSIANDLRKAAQSDDTKH